MKKQFKDFFDKTNQIHILLSGALLCIIITFVAPVTINFVIKPIVIIILSYILYHNYIETRKFQKISASGKKADDITVREMKTNILASYVLSLFILVLLLYVIYTTVK